jgi:GT2 family glycosyltransferase
LHSLRRQEPLLDEIIVVDNAPKDAASQRMIRLRYPKVRYVSEPIPGLNFARNRALSETQADIIAFLDDDAVADRQWARTLLEVFQRHSRVAVCTGRIDPLFLETDAQKLFEANGGFSRGLAPIHLPHAAAGLLNGRRAPLIAWAVSVGSGASFAVRRQTALDAGGFDEALDLGEALPGGGDLDMFWRLLTGGHELLYEPEAIAWHEHRRDLDSMAQQVAGHQRAMVAFLCKSLSQAPRGSRLPVAGFLAWRLSKPGLRLVRRVFTRDPLPSAVLMKMFVHTWRGLGAYPKAQSIARARRNAMAAQ